jgi:hypothetical protein
MVFADKTPMIKQTLVQQAMGFTDMPEWLKAERLNLR